MISLTDRKEDESEGAKFISEFAKPSRICPLLDTPPLLWEFTSRCGWTDALHLQNPDEVETSSDNALKRAWEMTPAR